jgi:hypothetical protein
MKQVTTASSLVTISHYKNLLVSEGIEATIKNQYLGSVMGEIPFQEAWPELWVINDIDLDRARQLIDASIQDESPTEPWICSKCKADNEGQFAVCWQCQAEGPDEN